MPRVSSRSERHQRSVQETQRPMHEHEQWSDHAIETLGGLARFFLMMAGCTFLTIGTSTRQRILLVAHADRDEDGIRIVGARTATPRESHGYQERRS